MMRIDGYPFDVAVTTEPTLEAEITDFPVESGSDVTDHIRPKPVKLKIEAWASDTPIGLIATDVTRQASTGSPRISKDAYDKLTSIFNARKLVAVECSFGKFESMAFEQLTPTDNAQTGHALHFTGSFKQINIKTNNRTTVRMAIPNGGKKKNLGDQNSAAQKKLLDNFPIQVVSYPTWQRASLVKIFGPVLFTRRGARELDCYDVKVAHVPADGFLTANTNKVSSDKYQYTPYESSQGDSGATGGAAGAKAFDKPSINGKPVHYDYSDKTWREDGTDKTLTHVPPGEDRWRYVTLGGK